MHPIGAESFSNALDVYNRMMAEDLDSIPTRELVERAARRPWEDAILQLATPASIVLTIALWFAAFRWVASELVPGIAVCLLASIAAPTAVLSSCRWVTRLRCRVLLHELDRRTGRWSVRDTIRYHKERVGEGEIHCVFQGRALPHGRSYWGCLRINDEGIVCFTATTSQGNDPLRGTEGRDVELPSDKSSQILNLVVNTKGLGKTFLPTTVRDGFPALIVTIVGDGSEPTVVFSNLGGLSKEQRADDRIKLLSAVAAIVCEDNRFLTTDEPLSPFRESGFSGGLLNPRQS